MRSSQTPSKAFDDLHISQPPKMRGWPLLGNINFAGEKGKFFRSCTGSITSAHILGKRFVIISDPKLAEKVYRREGTYVEGAMSWKTFAKLFGENSLIYLSGLQHRSLRSALLPCFRPSDLLKTVPQVQQISARRMRMWASEESVDGGARAEELVFELAMSFVGVQFDDLDLEETRQLCKGVHDFVSAFVSVPIDLGKWSQYGRGLLARNLVRSLVAKTISSRNAAKDGRIPPARKRMVENDLLQRMLDVRNASGEPLSMEVIQDTMLTFVVASFDTMAVSVTALLLNMCRFPEIQEKAHCHIRDVLGEDSDEYSKGATISDEQWQELEYIDQVLHETRRFDPPISTGSIRSAIKDFELGGYCIKKGSLILTEVLSASRSADLWDNPDTFDPDRFDKSRPDYKRKLAQLQTFGGGSKACIGKGFAQLQLKVIATLLLRDYRIEFADPLVVPKVIYPQNMSLDGPLQLKFTRRHR